MSEVKIFNSPTAQLVEYCITTYGEEYLVEKAHCIAHVQKRMGTVSSELKKQYRGQKLSDGKTIRCAGRLAVSVINSLTSNSGSYRRGLVAD